MAKPLTQEEISDVAGRIREVLADPDNGLTPLRRARWEGALAMAEQILGERPSLVPHLDLPL
jgi:hypothetical protein